MKHIMEHGSARKDFESIREKYIYDLFTRGPQKAGTYLEYTKTNLEISKEDIKYIVFYLPQFHPIKENDEWWGKGFTEWTNVSKAVPQFVGHYQPHLPGELGFYDLRVPEVMERQIELAKNYGIFGFCFYFYWFGGKTLLEMPVRRLLENPDMDMPFCLCWANENWTRRWDGLENEVLIQQKHSPGDDLAFIKYLESYMKDARYIRINNRPVLIVYRPSLLPAPEETVKIWREHCRNSGVGELFIIGAQAPGFFDYREVGFDASVEFPPCHLLNFCADIKYGLPIMNRNFSGKIADFASMVKSRVFLKCERFNPFKTVFPNWDNTARMQDTPLLMHNSTPELYKEWLIFASLYTRMKRSKEEQFVFINAWNEWAEGAHLEPDRKYGYAYLQATAEALLAYRSTSEKIN